MEANLGNSKATSPEEKLSDIFEKGFNIYYDLNSSNKPTNSEAFQSNVKQGISLLETATRIVSEAGVFASNEELEEVATADLKYLLLPAILGSLTLKLVGDNRLPTLETAEVYFKDYLARLKTYGVELPRYGAPVESETSPSSSESKDDDKKATKKPIPPELEAMVRKRNNKISRYKQQKEYEQKRLELKARVENGSAEDETVREYYTVLFNIWISAAVEELESIEMEKPILAHMANLKLEGKQPKLPPPAKKPLKPIILTKNELQKQVFGVGYPSIPSMTVNEFYTQRYGEHAKEHQPAAALLSMQQMAENPEQDALEREQEEEEKEDLAEKEDLIALGRAREWDDWKDDHRRGWGNRKNMG